MKGAKEILLIAAAATAGAGVSAAVVEHNFAPGRDTVRTVIRPVNVTSGANASALKTAGKSVNEIYTAASPAVVKIVSTIPASSQGSEFGTPSSGGQAQGTGFEIDRSGNIATNAHVVAGADKIRVITPSGTSYTAHLVGTDPTTDVAVIHIDAPADSLHPLSFADSSDVQVGDAVVAIGDPFGLTNTVTSGIVSALNRTITSPNNRPITGAIQTDAAINHGNSGGPLLNANGLVIGITSQIESGTSSTGNVGVGFAVPSNTARQIVNEILTNGKATHPYVGVYLRSSAAGPVIAKVVAGSPAAKAGLKVGDLITAVDGHDVASPAAVIARVTALKPGDQVAITITRGGHSQQITVTIGSEA